mgnify:CR=1 FL=1
MSYLGDTLTVGLVLILLFGSIALYLYTRIQQTEQKVSLLESIVLDLKLTGEIQGFGSLQSVESESQHLHPVASSPRQERQENQENQEKHEVLNLFDMVKSDNQGKEQDYKPFEEEESVDQLSTLEEPLFDAPDASRLEEVEVTPVSQYDHMTMKELQGLIRSRGLPSEKGAKKSALIEVLKKSDVNAEVKPGSMSSSSLLDNSVSVQDVNE